MSDGMRVGEPDVLMVDDEQRVADAYALRLEDVADVSVAYGAEDALDTLRDASTPDVILLDRHMPTMSGDEVLERIREMDLETRVIMVTAVDPGLDVLDLPFDDYLSKPVERPDLIAAVDQQCRVLAYDLLGDFFQLTSKAALVRAHRPEEELADSDRLAAIDERRAAVEARVRKLLPDAADLISEFTDIQRDGY